MAVGALHTTELGDKYLRTSHLKTVDNVDDFHGLVVREAVIDGEQCGVGVVAIESTGKLRAGKPMLFLCSRNLFGLFAEYDIRVRGRNVKSREGKSNTILECRRCHRIASAISASGAGPARYEFSAFPHVCG